MTFNDTHHKYEMLDAFEARPGAALHNVSIGMIESTRVNVGGAKTPGAPANTIDGLTIGVLSEPLEFIASVKASVTYAAVIVPGHCHELLVANNDNLIKARLATLIDIAVDQMLRQAVRFGVRNILEDAHQFGAYLDRMIVASLLPVRITGIHLQDHQASVANPAFHILKLRRLTDDEYRRNAAAHWSVPPTAPAYLGAPEYRK